MTFKIEAPGEYRRADGKKQVIAAVQDSLAIGFNGITVAWWATSDGRNCGNGAGGLSDPDADLIAPWTDAPILAKPAVFKVGDRVRAKCLVLPTGMATQLIDKGTECTVAAIHSARHLIFTLGGYRYPADCFELVTEPAASPEVTFGLADAVEDGSEPVRVNDGGPAFPGQQPTGFDPRSGNFNEGMTLRDYFAGQALVSIGSHKVNGLGWKLTGDLAYTRGEWKTSPNMQAEAAYRIADAMLTEAARREKEPT